jgi:TolB-like protein
MTSQLASALAAAHAANIIHRDVKPANVIVPRSGIVKLVDFGIAKLMTDTDEKHATAGTIAYMSPEQTREAALDARTDIWSLGVVLYEQLAGQRPFRGESDEVLISAIRNQPPPPLTKFRSEVPVQLARVVERCLQKEPAERYQTAEELCSALREWNTGATRSAHSRAPKIILVSLAVFVAAVLGTWGYSRYTGRSQRVDSAISHRTVSVAVLPLIDSTQTESTRYVTEGLADELRSELSRMRNVMVPSYLSSLPYVGTSKTMSQVASEMAANYVVTGAVRRSNDRERVNLRLVDGKNGRVLWTRELESSPGGRPSIARNATKAIVSKLGVSLTPEEKNRLDHAPTSNPVAYDLYLRGRSVELSGLPRNANAAIPVESIRRAQAFYSQARSLDRSFALARARLAVSHMLSATTYDTTPARRDQGRLEAEVALRMDSLLPEAHEALAAYWKRDGNPQKAIDELQAGLRATPNYIDLIVTMERVFVEAGRWEDGASMAERAMRLDPRTPRAAWQATTMYGRMRRYPEAQRARSRLIEISPHDYEVQVIKGQAYLRWKGSVDTLSAILRRIPPEWDVRGMATFGRYTVLRVQRRYRDALEMLDRAPSDLSRDGLVYHPKDLMRAEMYYGLGELGEARQYYESARRVLVDSLAVHPKDASIHAALGLAYAGLGRKRDAAPPSIAPRGPPAMCPGGRSRPPRPG